MPRPFLAYVGLVWLIVCALVWLAWRHPWPVTEWLTFALLLSAVAISENSTSPMAKYDLGLSYPISVAAVVLLGPLPGALVAAVSAVSLPDILRGQPASTIAFNIGQLTAVTLMGALVYAGFDGATLGGVGGSGPWDGASFASALPALVALAVTCALGNLAFIVVAVRVRYREPLWGTVRALLWVTLSQVPLAFMGFLMAQVLASTVSAFWLFVFPLLIARQLYQHYSGLKEAYLDTVRSLIGAIEAKDPYTRGHSERVAGYASQLGQRLGLSTSELDSLVQAALLHDVGKLAMSGAVLVKPSHLSSDEMKGMRLHPEVGSAMVARIPPLAGLASSIMYHHEWVDGSGYPNGLQGESIPRQARILAVADAYDAMTTSRAYRSALDGTDAIDELVRGSGTQFDPVMAELFVDIVRGQCVETAT